MLPSLDSSSRITSAGAAKSEADRILRHGQERRRGLNTFLTWPFLLGAAFATDELAAYSRAAAEPEQSAPHHGGDDSHPQGAAPTADPVSLTDWEPGPPQQQGDVLLPDIHGPLQLDVGGAAGMALLGPLEGEPAFPLSAGTGGGGTFAGSAVTGLPHELLSTAGDAGGEPLPGLTLGTNHMLTGSDGALSLSIAGINVDLNGIPIVGNLLGDVGGLVSSLLGGNNDGSQGAPGVLSSIGDVVASAGQLVFGPSQEGALTDLFSNGKYTDFGVAMSSNMDAGGESAAAHDPHDADQLLPVTLDGDHHSDSAAHHSDDQLHLRTPMDLLG